MNTGVNAIVRVSEIEKTGKYVYFRKQVLSRSNWVWDDHEYLISIGEKHVATYEMPTDKAYVSYQKDGRLYTHVFDLNNGLVWSYIPNIAIDPEGVITLNNDPTCSYGLINCSRRVSSISVVNAELFGMFGIAITFMGKDSNLYAHKPFMTDIYSYRDKLTADFIFEFYYKSGSNYILERSIMVPLSDNNDVIDRWIK